MTRYGSNHHILNVGYIRERLEDRPYYDALTVLTWVAARTERVRLGTTVLVLPYLNPLVLAKTVATLDVMSGGRVSLGVGVGMLREENEALGQRLQHARRLRRRVDPHHARLVDVRRPVV